MHEENIYVRPKSSRKIAPPRGKGEQKQDVPAFPSPIAGKRTVISGSFDLKVSQINVRCLFHNQKG